MQEFIELKQEAEFLLFLAGAMIVFGYAGFSYGEFEKAGGKPGDIVKNTNHHRAIALLRKIMR